MRGTWVVIAAYNEGEAIGGVVSDLVDDYPNVVVVDDGSGDDTADAAAGAGAVVLRHVINRGQGAALQTGITYALTRGAAYIVTFDADGQHQKSDLPALIGPLARGEVDICLGSRFLEHAGSVPLARRLLLSLAVLFTRLTSGVRLTDAHNGLRAFSRRAAARIDIRLDRMAHASELIDQIRQSGLPYREIPVHIRYTDYSLAKGQRGSAAFRVALDYLIGRVMR
ncbi:MAG: glycosyltransferase family 2 protein [Myxococcales bacterium]|nr:glycosyltransferase family 2 protein [Myxococcales bacterium]